MYFVGIAVIGSSNFPRMCLGQRALKRRKTTPTLKRIYDIYMTPDGHFAAGEQEDAVEDAKLRNGIDRRLSMSLPKTSAICPINRYLLCKVTVPLVPSPLISNFYSACLYHR